MLIEEISVECLLYANTVIGVGYTRFVPMVSSHVILKIETFSEEDTKYKKQ